MPGLARFIYIINLNCMCAGSAVYIIRSYNRVNQLHESRWRMDLSSHTCLSRRRIYCHSTAVIGITFVLISNAFIMLCLNRHVFSQIQRNSWICPNTIVPPVSARSRVISNMCRLVQCRLRIRMFPRFFTSSANLWSCCLCLYRRLSVQTLLCAHSGLIRRRRSSTCFSYHGRLRFVNFRPRL